jgi:general secretion pathway protein L
MTDRVLIRLAADGSMSWFDGRARAGAPSAAVLARARSVWVLVPAEDVLLARVRIAARNRTQLRKALPYAVEDQLIDPVEDLHFASGPADGAEVGVAAVAKPTLRAWLARLEAAAIRPDGMLPESLAVPLAGQRPAALLDGDRAIVRLAPWSAFACGLAELPAFLSGAALDGPLDVHDARPRSTTPPALPPNSTRRQVDDALSVLAGGLAQAAPLNLLDGEFAPRHRHARGLRTWRLAAALAAAVVALALVVRGAEVLRLSRDAARIETAIGDIARKALPGVDAATLARSDPEQLLRERVQGLGGGASSEGLLRLLGAIAPVLGSTTRVQTRGMEYRNGILELGLRAPDVATLDAMRERFAAVPGIDAQVTAANAIESGIDGRVRIAPEAP